MAQNQDFKRHLLDRLVKLRKLIECAVAIVRASIRLLDWRVFVLVLIIWQFKFGFMLGLNWQVNCLRLRSYDLR